MSGTDHIRGMDILFLLTFVEAMLQYGERSILTRDSGISNNAVDQVVGYSFPEAFKLPGFVITVLSEAKGILMERFDQFVSDEVQWIQSGKGGLVDTKMLGVFPAITKFPSFLDIVGDLSGPEVLADLIF